LTSFSKIFEKVIFNRLQHHLNINSILAREQYRFRAKLSTDLATFDLINNILLALNNKLAVGGLFCDLTKAFECVNHEILFAKLEFYGINGMMGKLIKSYLTDRHQRTLINNNSLVGVSDRQKVKQGVPQGSILGPLIFLIHINDLPYIINKTSKPILYADDTDDAGYAIRALSLIMSKESLLMTYYAYAHSIMSYGIVFWGNSTHGNQIFKIQKRIVRIIEKREIRTLVIHCSDR
jgi:hypothetical protein